MTLVTLTNHLNLNHLNHHHHHNCDRTCNHCANLNLNLVNMNNNNNNNISREEITYQHSVIPEATSQIVGITKQQQPTNITTNMSNQHQTNEQSLLITNNQQQSRRHKNSTASSVDPYSSLNLSSMGSSSNSSAQHSPLLMVAAPNEDACKNNNNKKELSSQLLAEQLASSCRVATSDYSRATSISCSPTTSPLSCELLLEDSSNDAGEAQEKPSSCDHHHNNNKQQELSSPINHLHPPSSGATTCQQQQQQQKVRSFSHSNTFSPLVVAANQLIVSPLSGRHSSIEVKEDQQQQQQPLSEVIIERPRRLSRIEHRQSLLDLGYGKIESYFKLQRLGKGTYATVYMGRSRLSNDLVALKEILKEHDEGAPCTAIREVSLLRLLRHNNIVTLHDICHTPKKLTLVFEYVGPDLYAYMKKNNNLLSIHNVRILLYQLLRGISFCHSRQVLHRDLKPQNLLINSRGELKICDFGLARAKSIPTKSYSNEVVTLWYRPPDVLLGNTDYDHSIDMWGVGCIFYEMASGRTFFPGSSVRQQLYLIFSSLGAPNRYNWPEILTNPDYQSYSFPPFRPEKLSHRVPRLDSNGVILLMSFLRFKPQERISAEEARRDPFFACLPEAVHQLGERESILDVPGVYMTLNPGQKLNHHI